MNCYDCGTQLPPGAKVCPNCGTFTPAYYANSGTSSNEPTISSGASSYGPTILSGAGPFPPAISAPPPTPHYGSNSYGAPLQDPYMPPNPYEQTPPPPPFRRPGKSGLFVGLVALVLVLIGGSVLVIQRPASMPVATSSPTSLTATHTNIQQDIYNQATSGNLAFNDPLTGQGSNNWVIVSTASQGSNCVFANGGYHAIMLQSGVMGCYANGTNFSNFAFQVQMTIIKGDGGGLLFRKSNPASFGYRFFVGPASYNLSYDDKQLTASPAGFKINLGQTYLLTVIARGSSILLYINKQRLATVEDKSSGSGTIGLMAYDGTQQTDVVYNNAKVWTL